MTDEKIPENPYRARVVLPEQVAEFIATFQGMGNLTINEGVAHFEFWAEDLWEAARMCQGIEQEVNTAFPVGEGTFIERPTEVSPGGIVAHDVKIPVMTPITRSNSHGGDSVWPAEAVRVILKDHGITVAE